MDEKALPAAGFQPLAKHQDDFVSRAAIEKLLTLWTELPYTNKARTCTSHTDPGP